MNNAIHDAAHLGRALNDVYHDQKPLREAIDAYEEEIVERGHDAVISSGQNSMMLTDWGQLMESPMMKYGLAKRWKQGLVHSFLLIKCWLSYIHHQCQ